MSSMSATKAAPTPPPPATVANLFVPASLLSSFVFLSAFKLLLLGITTLLFLAAVIYLLAMALAFSAPFKVILAPTFAVLYICTKAETNLPAALSLAVSSAALDILPTKVS